MNFGAGFATRRFEMAETFNFNVKRHVSVEIEVADCKGLHTLNHDDCAIESDSSVHGANPVELIIQSKNGDNLANTIDRVCKKIAGSKVNDTCGLHVHFDCRDLSWADLRKIILLWNGIESALFAMVPASRLTPPPGRSNYCKPMNKAMAKQLREARGEAAVEDLVARFNYGGRSLYESNKRNKYHQSRYQALNLHSYAYRGTIEFRLHSGTVEAEKIKNWVLLLSGVIDCALKAKKFREISLKIAFVKLLEIALAAGGPALTAYVRKRLDKFTPTWRATVNGDGAAVA